MHLAFWYYPAIRGPCAEIATTSSCLEIARKNKVDVNFNVHGRDDERHTKS